LMLQSITQQILMGVFVHNNKGVYVVVKQ